MLKNITTVGVYKTNVDDRLKARAIVAEIQKDLPASDSSFDLEDRDKVLRVENLIGKTDEGKVRRILKQHGYKMEKLL